MSDTVIRLRGKTTVNKINAVHSVFIQAIERKKPIRIDVEGVTEVDLSFVQVLISMAYSCSQHKIDIAVINAHETHPLTIYIEKMGFKNLKFL